MRQDPRTPITGCCSSPELWPRGPSTIEIVSAREFSGPVVLLSPSFSRQDESKFPRALDRLSGVFGHLPYSLMLKVIGPA